MFIAEYFFDASQALSLFLLAIAILVGIVNHKRFPVEFKFLFYLLSFLMGIEIITNTFTFFGRGNQIFYPFYLIGEFSLISIMFIKGMKLPKITYALIVIGVLAGSTEFFKLWHYQEDFYSAYSKGISNLVIVAMMGYSLIYHLRSLEKSNEYLLIYGVMFFNYLITLFLFLFLDQLSGISKNKAHIIWGMTNIFSSLFYGVSLLSFVRLKK